MSKMKSAFTGKAYGLKRVCETWQASRSTIYHHRAIATGKVRVDLPQKRGPKTTVSDEDLLGHIKTDLALSPFAGEGHRKVWARLRIQRNVRVSAKRVLRIMRENHLLSPHRNRQGSAIEHKGHIVTEAPNEMWGTDGARIFTAQDGWVWLFTAVEHWNAECVGWHVCKLGDRFAALQPIAMGLKSIYGSVGADVARGLSIRMDHGTQYLSDHFRNQIEFWGASVSFAFIEQPQTNGVAERFNRTIKEQVVHGRVFNDLEEVRAAIAAFIEKYNRYWLIEKLGFKTPLQARESASMALAA